MYVTLKRDQSHGNDEYNTVAFALVNFPFNLSTTTHNLEEALEACKIIEQVNYAQPSYLLVKTKYIFGFLPIVLKDTTNYKCFV